MPRSKRKLDDENDTTPLDDVENPKSKKLKKQARFKDEEDAMADLSQNPDFDVPDEAEVGIIEKVCVTNFMCHKKLEVALGANVNFVIGRNGSGKSAILTGLIVGLGGKANMTNRGNSLKGFIREGCPSCTVAVTLRNRGTDAYKPEAYGKSIIVERRLNADGGSGYKMKSCDNKVISTKRDELVAILDQFNIQIDNPVSILTQDTARSFLNTSDPKDKYAFFLKATQLEQMSTDYQRIIEEKERIKNTLEKKKEVLPDLAAEVKVHEEKYKDMQQLEDMKEKVQALKKKLAWAMVKEKNDEVNKHEENETTLNERIPTFQQKVDDTCTKEEVITTSYNEKCAEFDVYQEETSALVNERARLQKEHKQRRTAVKQAQEKRRKSERDVRSIEKDIKTILDRIQEIKASAQRDLESERQQRESQIERKRSELNEYEAKFSTSNHQRQQLESVIKNNKERKYQLTHETKDAQRQVENKRNRLQELENNKLNKLSLFGRSTGAILKAIDATHVRGKFHKKPVGPLGSLLKLKDPRWAIAVEECIKGHMLSYACHDSHDMVILKDIFKRCMEQRGRMPTIIMSSFVDHEYDVSRNRPQCSYPTVLDVLQFDDVIVNNTLIDQCGIEQVLLIEEAKQAQQVIWFQNLRNANKALTLEGHEILGGRSSKYYPSKKTHANYLQADVAATMRGVEAELVHLQNQLQDVQNRQRELDAEIRRESTELDRTKRICSQHQDKINNLSVELQDLESYEEEKLPDVDALEEEVNEFQTKRLKFQEQLADATSEEDQKKGAVQEYEVVWKKCEERCQEAVGIIEKLTGEKDSLEQELTTLKGHKKHYKERLDNLLDKIKTAVNAHESIKKEYEVLRSQALEYCEEVQTRRTVKSLESEIEKGLKRIVREESTRGNVEEVRNKYHAVLQRYHETKATYDNCALLRKLIDKALRRRARRFENFQTALTVRARKYFEMLLSQRGYTGKMRIDHDEETLIVQVNVENAAGASTKDSKALSGGERSFSTICFIMALWEAMEAPFRCLDEFDVFMDMLNRRISMNMLMKIAKEQQARQFILLTPQDMSNVNGSNRVRIFRLRDPERGQQTIPFQPT